LTKKTRGNLHYDKNIENLPPIIDKKKPAKQGGTGGVKKGGGAGKEQVTKRKGFFVPWGVLKR